MSSMIPHSRPTFGRAVRNSAIPVRQSLNYMSVCAVKIVENPNTLDFVPQPTTTQVTASGRSETERSPTAITALTCWCPDCPAAAVHCTAVVQLSSSSQWSACDNYYYCNDDYTRAYSTSATSSSCLLEIELDGFLTAAARYGVFVSVFVSVRK